MGKSKYENFQYDEDIKKLLNIVLEKSQEEQLEEVMRNYNNLKIERRYRYIIKDLFIFVKIYKLSTRDIANIYSISIRTVQLWLKELKIKIKESKNKELTNKVKVNPNYKKKSRVKFNRTIDEYIDFKYKQKELDLFENTTLTKEDLDKIEEIKQIYLNRKNYLIAKEVYIMWKNNYSPDNIAKVYGKDSRSFQVFFKEVGLNRDRYEAQAIASKKRNYKDIMLKGRETMIKNNTSIFGSKQEIYLRTLLNCRLPMELPNSEVIIGLNNKSILNDGKEIDIPIIIISGRNTYKFAVEYNGDFWHNEEKDKLKVDLANKKEYKLFYIQPKAHSTNKKIKEQIEWDIDNIIIPSIKEDINKYNQCRKDAI